MSVTTCAVDERVIGQVGEVAALYARCAGVVRGQVRAGVTASEAVVDDACQFAWVRLLYLRHRVRRDKAISWLITTALHEAFKVARRDGYELSLEEVMQETDDLRLSRSSPAPEEIVEPRLRLETLRELPERQERLIWLQGLGFSYPEMANETDATVRTVERQLVKARRNLKRLEAA
jgi:RNA polymerase sigma factor (sigma-70 family)